MNDFAIFPLNFNEVPSRTKFTVYLNNVLDKYGIKLVGSVPVCLGVTQNLILDYLCDLQDNNTRRELRTIEIDTVEALRMNYNGDWQKRGETFDDDCFTLMVVRILLYNDRLELYRFPNLPMCGHCNALEEEVKFLTCGKCRNIKYCSKDCQTKDWKEQHKNECVKLTKIK
jgi:hypothetical protein